MGGTEVMIDELMGHEGEFSRLLFLRIDLSSDFISEKAQPFAPS